MLKRLGVWAALCAFCGGAALGAAPSLLVHIERRTPDDLALLRAADMPVVMEMETCLFLAGEPRHTAWLTEHGYKTTVVEQDPGRYEHLVVGLRPDSDRAAVEALGRILWSAENWVLVQVAPGASTESLESARVFVAPMKLRPLVAPPPAAPGAAPVAALGVPVPLVQQIVGSVSTAQIDQYWADLTSNPPTGTRYSTNQGCRDAASYCKTSYDGMDLPNEFQNWSVSHAPNVIATQRGAVTPEVVYIAIGHLDDLPSSGLAPGADDNASGSVMVLEAARVLSCYGLRNTVKFINCTGEEFGLYGSDAYAQDAQNRHENIQGVINADMIGWAGDGIPNPENLDLDYNTVSQPLAQQFTAAATTYGTGLAVDPIYCPSLTASDHAPFWERGWKALCAITDNEGYCGHGGNYPYYHGSNDTIANCGAKPFFYSVIKTAVATLAELGGPFKITFDRATYACTGGTLQIFLADRDLNTDPGTVQTVTVPVWSGTEPTPEIVVLTEDGADSMIFKGSITTTTASPVHGDGLISVGPDDTVTASYVDALDCTGATNVQYTTTGTIDCSVPVITNVGETAVTDVAATITWTTNEAADGVVVYGPTKPPTITSGEGPLATSHSIPLNGLQGCTVYYYEVRSRDEAGNLTVDNNGGQYHRFETLGDFGSGLQPCHAGRVSLDKTVYGCGGAAQAKVIDIDLNQNPSAVETVAIEMSSSSETTPETLILTETGPATSTFVGSIALDAGPVAHDGVLQVRGGDIVTATYHDADDGSDARAVSYAAGSADCTGPRITSLAVADQPPGRVAVSWTTEAPSNSRVDYGPTAALGRTVSDAALTTAHSLSLGSLGMCGTFYFRVSSTDAQGNTTVADRGGLMFSFETGNIPGLLFYDDFENSTGWTLGTAGEWQIGAPQGLGGTSYKDPTVAWSGSKVLGNDLSGLGANPGDYEPLVTSSIAESPQINARNVGNVKLMFRRWLGVEAAVWDKATVVAYKNSWLAVWNNAQFDPLYDGAWVQQDLDITQEGAGNQRLKIGFAITSNATNQHCGWNIDDVVVKDGSLPDAGVCGGCTNTPSFAGLASATDVDACADTGVALAWPPAAAWGSGGAGTYAVYRDTTPNFTPSAANRLAAGLTATNYTDAAAPNGTTLYYFVRAENNETCGAGPNNGGATDDNTVYLAAQDSTFQAAPGDVGGTVLVSRIADSHVRLNWAAAPNAVKHRVRRADNPQMIGAFLVGETAGLQFEDVGEATRLTSRFYLVRGVNACGVEGP